MNIQTSRITYKVIALLSAIILAPWKRSTLVTKER